MVRAPGARRWCSAGPSAGADRLSQRLGRSGLKSAAIHGDRSQSQRERALAAFRAGRLDVLVATDVAAAGHPRRRRASGRPLRPAGRPHRLRAPLGPDRSGRRRRPRRFPRRPRTCPRHEGPHATAGALPGHLCARHLLPLRVGRCSHPAIHRADRPQRPERERLRRARRPRPPFASRPGPVRTPSTAWRATHLAALSVAGTPRSGPACILGFADTAAPVPAGPGRWPDPDPPALRVLSPRRAAGRPTS